MGFLWLIGGEGKRARERQNSRGRGEKRERREGCEPRRNVGFRFDISARGGHESRGGGFAGGWDPPLRASRQDSFSPPIHESPPPPLCSSFSRSLASQFHV